MKSAAAPVTSLAPEIHATVAGALARQRNQPGPLLLILHEIQATLGYIPSGSIPVIAEGLNLSRAEVYGVVTFYHYFRQTPPGEHIVQVCQAEACRSMNSVALTRHIEHRLGIGLHETTADGRFTLEPVYCLGNCACSPALTIDGELHGRVRPDTFDALLDSMQVVQ